MNRNHLPTDRYARDEELEDDREHALQVIGFGLCLTASAVTGGFGLYRVLVGQLDGWLGFVVAGCFAAAALKVGERLDAEDDR